MYLYMYFFEWKNIYNIHRLKNGRINHFKNSLKEGGNK